MALRSRWWEGASVNELPAGTTLQGGRYRIEACIGVGGFGGTYLATESRSDGDERTVAVKELCPSLDGDRCQRSASGDLVAPAGKDAMLDELRASTLREAQTLAALDVSGVVGVYNHFEEHGTAYIVMEFVSGVALRERLGAPWEDIAARRLITQLGRVLRELHANGVVHRDLTPSNIILDSDNNPTVIDFGLARTLSTLQSSWSGTKGYGAPEQFGSVPGEVAPATDVFALAVIAGEVFTGHRPTEVLPLRAKPDLDQAVAAAIIHGCAPRPEDRTPTVDQFLLELTGRGTSGAIGATGLSGPPESSAFPSNFTEAVPRPEGALPTAGPTTAKDGSRRHLGLTLLAAGLGVLALLIVVAAVFGADGLRTTSTTTVAPASTAPPDPALAAPSSIASTATTTSVAVTNPPPPLATIGAGKFAGTATGIVGVPAASVSVELDGRLDPALQPSGSPYLDITFIDYESPCTFASSSFAGVSTVTGTYRFNNGWACTGDPMSTEVFLVSGTSESITVTLPAAQGDVVIKADRVS